MAARSVAAHEADWPEQRCSTGCRRRSANAMGLKVRFERAVLHVRCHAQSGESWLHWNVQGSICASMKNWSEKLAATETTKALGGRPHNSFCFVPRGFAHVRCDSPNLPSRAQISGLAIYVGRVPNKNKNALPSSQ